MVNNPESRLNKPEGFNVNSHGRNLWDRMTIATATPNGVEYNMIDSMKNIQPHSWLRCQYQRNFPWVSPHGYSYLIASRFALRTLIPVPCIAYMAIHIQSLHDYEIIQYICSMGFIKLRRICIKAGSGWCRFAICTF